MKEFEKLKNKKLGLVLEGGGARGAYQIGVLKALFENGMHFDAVVGTSIGAINGAYIAQGSFDKIYSMWQNLSFKELFGYDNDKVLHLLNNELDMDTVRYFSKKLNSVIKDGGIDTLKMRKIVVDSIDEEKIRNSDISFGLVTLCLSDMKPEEVFVEDIEKGKLPDYIMATSNLPVFKRAVINGKKYLDGGSWDNCPVNMLEKKGYKDAIVIRAYKRNRIRGYNSILKRNKIKMHMIEPTDSLGSILNFDSSNLNYLLKYGYYDGLKYINEYLGNKYYINCLSKDVLEMFSNFDFREIALLATRLNVKLIYGNNVKDELIDKIIPELLKRLKIQSNSNNGTPEEDAILIFEYIANKLKIERFKIYSLDEFIDEIVRVGSSNNELNNIDKIAFNFVKAIKD